jgi:hypothetical protein
MAAGAFETAMEEEAGPIPDALSTCPNFLLRESFGDMTDFTEKGECGFDA